MSLTFRYPHEQVKAAFDKTFNEFTKKAPDWDIEILLAKGIDEMLRFLEKRLSQDEYESIIKDDPILREVDEFSWSGPVGIGLGRYGCHCVGDED